MGHSLPSDSLRKLFSLSAHWGGLGLPVLSLIWATELAASHNICEPLCDFISNKSLSFAEVPSSQLYRKSLICKLKAENYSSLSSALCEDFDQSLRCSVDFASVKGASSWLTALPFQEHWFALYKSASWMLWLYTMVSCLLGLLHFVPVVPLFCGPCTVLF